MAKNTQLANATVNGQADDLAARLNNGYLRIYDGSQPTNANTAVSTQTLLAELRFNATAAPSAVNGVLTFNALTPDSSANASGTASWFRALSSDGSTAVMDGTVGETADTPNLVLSSKAISAGASVSVSSFTHTVQKATSGL
jgi:hypothetical protein